MTRNEQILSEVQKHFINDKTHIASKINAFIDGAKWADKHPDSKHPYTKQQLIDMGFAFTTNGDIVTPDQLNEDLKKYLEYQKRKFIEKLEKWIRNNTDWNEEYIWDGRNPNYGLWNELKKFMEE